MARVLIVDDNHDAADTLSFLLRVWGYTTATAYDGPAALDNARTFCSDIVLLELRMPGMAGLEVARRLRSEAVRQSMRLVAISGYGGSEDKLEAYRAGFERHLLKPVDEVTLRTVLERYSQQTEPKTTVKERKEIRNPP